MTKISALILCMAFCGGAFAADETPPPLTLDRAFVPPGAKEISRIELNALVEQLAGDDASAQKTAHTQLVALLGDAIPRLELLIRETSDENLRKRAHRVMDDIRGEACVAPARVTVHMQGGPVELLTAIFREAHLPMAKYPLDFADDPSQPPITINFDRRPFWPAVKEVCEASGMDVRRVYDDTRLTVIRGENPPVHGPSNIAGPFILYAQAGGDPTKIGAEDRTGQLIVGLCCEPRVRVVAATLHVDAVLDENGSSLVPAGAPKNGDYAAHAETDFFWQAQFAAHPARFSKRVARFAGTFKVRVQTDATTLDLPTKPGIAPIHREVAGYTVDVHGMDHVGDGDMLKLRLSRGKLEPWQWDWFREPMRRVTVLDEKGVPLRVAGSGYSTSEKQSECTVTFTPGDGTLTPASGPPAKLTWELPTKSKVVEIPFELIDINLPIANAN
jgi:hypothetical protein